MVPKPVLIALPTTRNTTNSTTTTNVLPFPLPLVQRFCRIFGVYQQTSIGSSDISTHILVPDAIIVELYRNALIIKLLFQKIITLSDNHSVSFSDIMSALASYFVLNTGSAEKETEPTVTDIRNDFSLVSNLQGISFSDVSGKPITIQDLDRRPTNLTYFTIRLVIFAATVDICAPIS